MSIPQMFTEAGFMAYFVACGSVFATLLALAAAIVSFSRKRRLGLGLGGAALLSALLVVVLGIAGYLIGMSTVNDALAYVDPERRDELLAVGRAEALQNVWCALMGFALPLLLSLAALGRSMTLPRDA